MKVYLIFYSSDFLDIEGIEDELKEFDEFIIDTGLNAAYKTYKIDTDNRKLKKLIKLSEKVEDGVHFIPSTNYDSDEIESVRFYEVLGDKKLKESRTDCNKNRKYELNTKLIESGSGYKIRLIDKRFLKSIKLKNDTIGCIGDGRIADYIISEAVKNKFDQFELKGAKYLPVYHTNGKDQHCGYYQIFTEEIMPPAEIDLAFRTTETFLMGKTFLHFNKFGSLSFKYELIKSDIDFLRSAEPIYCEETTTMIVSEKVRNCYNASDMKGLSFYPVLDVRSELYRQYIERWGMVYEIVFSNPQNALLDYKLGG